MTAGNPPLNLLGLPAEILESTILQLRAQEILKLRILNRVFRDLIDASPSVQYRIDLFSAASEDDPRETSLVLADRRAHLEQYCSRWDRHEQAKKSSIDLPPHTSRVIDGEVLACIQEAESGKIDVTFVQLPSVSKGVRRKHWVVKGLPENVSDLKMLPGLDLLVIPEVVDERNAFQIHLLQLSDGRPHPLATADQAVFHIDRWERKAIKTVSISERRLAVVVDDSHWDNSDIFVWDWRDGRMVSKFKGFCVSAAQMVDDRRILGVIKHLDNRKSGMLAVWDTSEPQQQWYHFEMPSNKLDVVYVPERLTDSMSVQRGMGLHRADPDQEIVGVVCQGSYGDVRLDDGYMIVITIADLCAYASAQGAGEHKIRWEEWQSSTTIVRINFAITPVACISGSRFFAIVKGLSYTGYATLLRIYDFSPGARGRRHPKRSPVRDLVVNAGRVVKEIGLANWTLSEDNLLMFNKGDVASLDDVTDLEEIIPYSIWHLLLGNNFSSHGTGSNG